NTTTGSILVDIVDDIPTAHANTNSVSEGAQASGNVLTDGTADVLGADGAAPGGAVTGVATGSNVSNPVSGNLGGAGIAGQYGTLVLGANGAYTYTANANAVTTNAVDHFVYTITDGDGDTSTVTLDITVNNVTVTASDTDALVSEKGLATGSDAAGNSEIFNGAITPAGGTGPYTYTLTSPASGSYGNLVLNANGTYTYTLTQTYDGVTTNNGITTEQDKDSFTYTVTDAHGNTTTGSILVDIVDDIPTAISPASAVVANGAGASVTFDLDIDGVLTNNYGADGGTVIFPTSLDGTASGLTSNGVSIVYDVSADGHTLTGFAGAISVFVVTLDPATASYSVDMNGAVDSITTVDFNGGGYNFVGGNGAWAGFNTLVNDDSRDLLLTPVESGVSSGTLNTNANEGGVSGGNSVGSGEKMRLDYVVDLTGSPPNGSYSSPSTHLFEQHYVTNGASAKFTGISSSSAARFAAFDDSDTGGNVVVGDGVQDSVSAVAISYNGQTKLVSFTDIGTTATNVTVGGEIFTVHFVDGAAAGTQYEVVVGSILQNTSIATYTANGYNSLEIGFESGDTFKLGDFGAAASTNSPVSFDLPVSVVDGDGDTAAGTIGITLSPTGQTVQNHSADLAGDPHSYTSTLAAPHIIGSDFSDTLTGDGATNVLFGGLGNDAINGGAGNDTLIGGFGQDTMTGGTGADTFKLDGLDIKDLIVDYNGGQGDKIDLTSLFDTAPGGANVGDFVNYDSATGTLSVDHDGTTGGANFVDVATLSNLPAANTITLLYDDGATQHTTTANLVG
ncbi:Ig-like domain-containing protein, partial [Mesorhizobium sp. M7A.F.Ca.MR.362.00.0.0]|uniref:beta strand repeat-containing protein n=1 Tax=Mesorhizobium sp. M7A.F.Ca.MR.362.00.0.0 TaxID=2496779 RepID=UPI000FD52DC4